DAELAGGLAGHRACPCGHGDRRRDAREVAVHPGVHELADVRDLFEEVPEQELRRAAIQADHGDPRALLHADPPVVVGSSHPGGGRGEAAPAPAVRSCYQRPASGPSCENARPMSLLRRVLYWHAVVWTGCGVAIAVAPRWVLVSLFDQPAYPQY